MNITRNNINFTIGSSAILPEFNHGSLTNGRKHNPVFGLPNRSNNSLEEIQKNYKPIDIFGSLLEKAFLTTSENSKDKSNLDDSRGKLRLLKKQSDQQFSPPKVKATFFNNEWQKKTTDFLHDYWA